MKLDPIPALIATDASVKNAIKEASTIVVWFSCGAASAKGTAATS